MTITIRDTEYTEADVPLELAVYAIAIQDACNLSGLALTFGKMVMPALCDHPRNCGTAWKNHHPIVVLWLNKMTNLCTGDCGDDDGAFSKAYGLCADVVEAAKAVPA